MRRVSIVDDAGLSERLALAARLLRFGREEQVIVRQLRDSVHRRWANLRQRTEDDLADDLRVGGVVHIQIYYSWRVRERHHRAVAIQQWRAMECHRCLLDVVVVALTWPPPAADFRRMPRIADIERQQDRLAL